MVTLNNFFKYSDLSGVICLESASRINNLSTFPPLPLMLFTETKKDRALGYLNFYTQEEVDLRYTIQAGVNLHFTIPERTIIDLIRYEREDRFTFECLEKYLRSNAKDKLYSVAREYDCMLQVLDKLNELDFWLEEQNDY
ncbi:hypothetical protein [Paenibacillus medicaginis]|uniref:IDEAL domain-containing protein n=1 Tax=Paenibacillus medicaginis TaxID=1470560 RepID=A0ABV5C6V9_9BACL